ncbi:nucleotidyltransferase family protein [Neobacillus ginsengisoli]|uniref:Nucleotidyltransferase family protein n=1 Tax=Neobacillus ginsengisoli TaxID=904295 RepID=A0ABT9XTQ4_9BACI|nr:nucleotidyltransferase family protein [Neobacillus ginsengisoli]MDQ0198763.1 hypothetical protein [Neobacillus ginsengisoli]
MSMELVKAIYNQQSPMLYDENFYHKALQDIENDGISSQIYFLLKMLGRIEQTPVFFQKRLKDTYDQGLYQNLFIKNQLELILRRFEDQGIDVIPIKGVYFAEKYFGHIGARATSDIDLLIRQHDLSKAIDTVKLLGFTVDGEEIPGHFHSSFCKEIPHSSIPLVVEIHWNLVKENTANFQIDDLWNESISIGSSTHIKELSPNHTFYMICLHGWRHNLDSLKYFLDIIQVIYKHRDELDYEQIFKLAQSHRTYKRMIRTLSIVYQQFPELDYMKKFSKKRRKTLWDYRSQKGFKRYVDFIDYQFFSYDSFKHSLTEFHNWLWPSRHDLSSELGLNRQAQSFLKMYLSLYKKRVTSMIKALLPH